MRRQTMRGAVLYGPRDVRFEERESPRIVEPTDAIIRISLTCVCGSDLWPYRGLEAINGPRPMGHEYCGIVELFFAHVHLHGGPAPVRRYLPKLIDQVWNGENQPRQGVRPDPAPRPSGGRLPCD